ncbi:MAG: hypothetical protein PHC75_07065 [Burkholderiales bacterium]|nr:hypothetical protein [Burkholderiales bacterium]
MMKLDTSLIETQLKKIREANLLTDLSNELDDVRLENKQLSDENSTIKDGNKLLLKPLFSAQEQLEGFMSDNKKSSEYQKLYESLLNDLELIKSENESFKSQLFNSLDSNKNLSAKVSKLTKQLNLEMKQKLEIDSKLSEHIKSNKSLEDENKLLLEQLFFTQEKFDGIILKNNEVSKYQELYTKQCSDLELIKSECESLKAKLDDSQKIKKSLSAEISKLTEQLGLEVKQKNKHQELYTKQCSDLEQIKSECSLLKSKIDDGLKIKKNLSAETSKLTKQLNLETKQKSEIDSKLSEYIHSNKSLKDENKLLFEQLFSTQEKFEKFASDNKEARKYQKLYESSLDELESTKLELDDFHKYYKAINSVEHNKGIYYKFKTLFGLNGSYPTLVVNKIENVNQITSSQMVRLSNIPAWVELDVTPHKRLELYAKILYENIPLCVKKKSLICIQYLDKNGDILKGIYGRSPYSEKLGSNFSYLEATTTDDQKIFSFLTPDNAVKLRVGFATHGLYQIESVFMSSIIRLIEVK